MSQAFGVVSGGDEIDVMNSLLLQVQNLIRKLCLCDGMSHALTADGAVLTKDTPQVAPRKEYGSRAALTADGRLLPQMGRTAGYEEFRGHLTYAPLVFLSIHTARTWTSRAYICFRFGHFLRPFFFFIYYTTITKRFQVFFVFF
jgi:hypothetical protein